MSKKSIEAYNPKLLAKQQEGSNASQALLEQAKNSSASGSTGSHSNNSDVKATGCCPVFKSCFGGDSSE